MIEFTLSSVHCAESKTATKSVNGSECFRGTSGLGKYSSNISLIFSLLSLFLNVSNVCYRRQLLYYRDINFLWERDMRYILFLLVLLASSFSFAQEASDSEELSNIEEVVTSATRKETALQETALAVTVISSDDIELSLIHI